MVKIEKDETIAFVDSKYRKYLINTSWKTDRYKGIGVITPHDFVGKKYGAQLEIGNKKFWLLQPSMQDKLQGLKRKAQIITSKDIAQIIVHCSIEPGKKVLEAGIGSGSLTIALASIVKPNGRVFSYDIRQDFIEFARDNLKKAELEQYVETKKRDVNRGIEEKDFDAIILDIPDPWKTIKHVYNSLKTGGYLCCYSPLTSQVEKTVEEIRKHRFIEIETFENIQRKMMVSDRGMRPCFNMLGHTGYITFARKVE
ncbi:MAG: tRNA (adenine-N1)-methyltransferase [Candidatus Thermoplasmatota archaeon]